MDQFIRRIVITSTDGHKYSLSMYDTGHTDETGHTLIAYKFGMVKAGPLFVGRDYGCPSSVAIDSDESVKGLLDFLTLRPGDTDAEYFETYTPAQLEWASTKAEALQLAVYERFTDQVSVAHED